ncbi:MAG TPA: hypothetical protein PKL67_03455 [Anaerolineae bacterium]|nr:hypothetical protein [Anaerolineae bacterium]
MFGVELGWLAKQPARFFVNRVCWDWYAEDHMRPVNDTLLDEMTSRLLARRLAEQAEQRGVDREVLATMLIAEGLAKYEVSPII